MSGETALLLRGSSAEPRRDERLQRAPSLRVRKVLSHEGSANVGKSFSDAFIAMKKEKNVILVR